MLSLEYIAGLFDGEGSLGVYSNEPNKYTFRVQLVQIQTPASQAVWDELCTRWGGCVGRSATVRGDVKLNWQLGRRDGVAFLKEIQPFCTIKAEQIETALCWAEVQGEPQRGDDGRMLSNTPMQREALDAAIVELKALKRRGRMLFEREIDREPGE